MRCASSTMIEKICGSVHKSGAPHVDPKNYGSHLSGHPQEGTNLKDQQNLPCINPRPFQSSRKPVLNEPKFVETAIGEVWSSNGLDQQSAPSATRVTKQILFADAALCPYTAHVLCHTFRFRAHDIQCL